MEQNYRIENDMMVYRMPSELDHHVAERIAAEMDLLIDTKGIRMLILDFSNTVFMDSSGIGTIIGRCKKLKYLDGKVKTINMNDRVFRLFTAAGLHRIIECDKEDCNVSAK